MSLTDRLPLMFVTAAATCLLVGVCLGIGMGISHDFHLAPVHAHLNLLGWTSLSLMGLTYRAFADLAARRVLAWTQFALSASAAMVFPFGIYLSIQHDSPGLAIGAALVWLAGCALFLGQLVALTLRREAPAPRAAMMAAE